MISKRREAVANGADFTNVATSRRCFKLRSGTNKTGELPGVGRRSSWSTRDRMSFAGTDAKILRANSVAFDFVLIAVLHTVATPLPKGNSTLSMRRGAESDLTDCRRSHHWHRSYGCRGGCGGVDGRTRHLDVTREIGPRRFPGIGNHIGVGVDPIGEIAVRRNC